MDPKEVLKLIEAGFTADEIRKMMPEEKKTEPAQPEPKKEEPKKAEPKIAKAEEPKKAEPKIAKAEEPKQAEPKIAKAEEPKKEEPAGTNFDEIISGINKKIDDLTGAIGKISKISLFPAMENVKSLGIDDVIDNFFKEE